MYTQQTTADHMVQTSGTRPNKKPGINWLPAAGLALILFFPAKTDAATFYPSLSYFRYLSFLTSIYRFSPLLVGHDLNGMDLNGDFIEGSFAVSVSLDNVLIDDRYATLVALEYGALVGRDHRGRNLHPRAFTGARMEATLDNGGILPFRIDAVYRGNDLATRHIHYYEVSYETDEGWLPLCGLDDYGSPIPAIPLNGRWDYSEGTETGGDKIADPSVITFGCRDFVLAKCVESGYAPWMPVTRCKPWHRNCSPETLEAHHQACTRMMRADYCGDGTSHTIDGVEINPYDNLGVRSDQLDWELEAEWDEFGAICMDTERIEGNVPTCMEWLSDETCGDTSHFNDGTLIMSEI